MQRARAVVIGGGITGCSVAYHLAKAGWSDVLLVDKGELTSGSTAHAAGLVTTFNPAATMMRIRSYSIDLYRDLGVFETVGSLRFASTPEQLTELRRGVSRARGIGLDVDLVSPEEARGLMPAAGPGIAVRRSLGSPGRIPGPAFGDAQARESGAGTGGHDPHRCACYGDRAGVEGRGPGRDDRRGTDRVRGHRERGGHLGAAGCSDGGRIRSVDPRRPPAHRPEGRPGQRDAA